MDRTAEIWTRATGEPRHLGKLVLAGNQVRFSYARDAGDLPGLSMVHDTRALAGETITWPSTDNNPLPPMLQALVPPDQVSGLQRRILLRVLERNGVSIAKGPDLEWNLLLLGGRNGIGHLDVFEDNSSARAWYASGCQSGSPFTLEERSLWRLAAASLQGDIDAPTLDEVIDAMEIHPTSGGAMPKVLIPIRPSGTDDPVDALVKFQGENYPDILRFENVAYRIYDRLETDVPPRWLKATDDAVLLATRRFDRVGGLPVPMESAFSVLFTATGSGVSRAWSEESTWPNFEILAKAIFNPELGLSADPKLDTRKLYTRIAANVLMGISDMHLMNFSFLGRRSEGGLSPVYDPAPTKGYQSLSCVSVVSFGGLVTSRQDESPKIGDALLELGRAFRISSPQARRNVDHVLQVTEDYPEMIEASGADESRTRRLLGKIEGTRYRVERSVASPARAEAPSTPAGP
jgi:serine/threonine-protein kinase HipA